MTTELRTLGAIPSGYSAEDHTPEQHISMAAATPPKFQLPQFSAALNQGAVGACVGFSGIVGRAYGEYAEGGFLQPSNNGALQVYHEAGGAGGGIAIRDAASVLQKSGAPIGAARYKMANYARLSSFGEMEAAIFAPGSNGVWLCVNWDAAWDGKLLRGNIAPKPSGNKRGWHALWIIGYDRGLQKFLVQNSWGPRWGGNGRFWMPYAYVSPTSSNAEAWQCFDAADRSMIVTPFPAKKVWHVAAGTTINAWNSRGILAKTDHWTRSSGAFADAQVSISWTGEIPAMPSGLYLRVTTGTYTGLLIPAASVTLS